MDRPARAAITAALLWPLVGCSPPDLVAAPDVSCSTNRTSDVTNDVVERVGGLRTDGLVMRLAQSTDAEVVALVDRDVDGAYDLLHDQYGVAVVARITGDDGGGAADGFAQVRAIVDDVCAAGRG